MHLSIIIPAFNEELLIEECLKSVHASLDANAKRGRITELMVVAYAPSDRRREKAHENRVLQAL